MYCLLGRITDWVTNWATLTEISSLLLTIFWIGLVYSLNVFVTTSSIDLRLLQFLPNYKLSFICYTRAIRIPLDYILGLFKVGQAWVVESWWVRWVYFSGSTWLICTILSYYTVSATGRWIAQQILCCGMSFATSARLQSVEVTPKWHL